MSAGHIDTGTRGLVNGKLRWALGVDWALIIRLWLKRPLCCGCVRGGQILPRIFCHFRCSDCTKATTLASTARSSYSEVNDNGVTARPRCWERWRSNRRSLLSASLLSPNMFSPCRFWLLPSAGGGGSNTQSCVFPLLRSWRLSEIPTHLCCFCRFSHASCRFADSPSSLARLSLARFGLAVGATVNILDWKLVLGCGAFSRMFAAANC